MKIKYFLLLFIVGFTSCNENIKKNKSKNTTEDILFICTSVDEVNGNKNGTFLTGTDCRYKS